jgi:hypothetical protein
MVWPPSTKTIPSSNVVALLFSHVYSTVVEKVTKADPDLVHGSLVLNVPQAFGENRPKLKEGKKGISWEGFPHFL